MTTAYPLAWPDGWKRTRPEDREPGGQFQTTPGMTMLKLREELRKLGAQRVIISTNVPTKKSGDVFADHLEQRIADPGAAIYFDLGLRSVAMARDTYRTPHKNLHSLMLAIAAMRALDRHGGASMVERAFTGFTALPSPEEPWWKTLGVRDDATPDEIKIAFRVLLKTLHSDVHGGDDEKTKRLILARDKGLAARTLK